MVLRSRLRRFGFCLGVLGSLRFCGPGFGLGLGPGRSFFGRSCFGRSLFGRILFSGGFSACAFTFRGAGGGGAGSCAASCYHASLEFSGLGSGGDRWLAVIDGSAQAAVAGCSFLLASLFGCWSDMPFAFVPFLFCSRPCGESSAAAVVAHVAHASIDDRLGVNVVDDRAVYVHDGGVIEKVSALPVASGEADANVAEAVVNASVKTDVRSPVTGIPGVDAISPTPVTGSPEETSFRRENPGAGYPVVVSIVPSPVAGRPEIAISGTNGLGINRQSWRSNRDGHADLRD